MLLDEIISYCDGKFKSTNCNNCTHPSKCPGNCEKCLEQVHFPSRSEYCGRLDYTCDKILNYYVCKYIYKYSSEIEYALDIVNDLSKLSEFNILSLGCGGCPDLIAIENYLKKNNLKKTINYSGIEINEKWKQVHKVIHNYSKTKNISLTYWYEDVIESFKNESLREINILVIQYLLSHFYNNKQDISVKKFFKRLVKNVVKYMKKGSKIIINDVNSCYRGRDLFFLLLDILNEKEIKHSYICKYFNYNIKNESQRYGSKYLSNDILTMPSDGLDGYSPWLKCSSAQLIIELM